MLWRRVGAGVVAAYVATLAFRATQPATAVQLRGVDSLLMSILQMLLGDQSAAAGTDENQDSADKGSAESSEDAATTEAPLPLDEETTSAPPVAGGAGSGLTSAQTDALIQSAVTAENNKWGALTQQLSAVQEELAALRAVRERASSEDAQQSADNHISLVLKYPGPAAEAEAANAAAKNAADAAAAAAAQAAAMREEAAGSSEETVPDPSLLAVPVIVVAPKRSDDFHELYMKTLREAQDPSKASALTAEAEARAQVDPARRLAMDQRLYREALSRQAFFDRDLQLTSQRLQTGEPVTTTSTKAPSWFKRVLKRN